MTLIIGVVFVVLSLLIDLGLRPAEPPIWAMLMGLIGLVVILVGLGLTAWDLLS